MDLGNCRNEVGMGCRLPECCRVLGMVERLLSDLNHGCENEVKLSLTQLITINKHLWFGFHFLTLA